MTAAPAIEPPGVKLTDWDDFDAHREAIYSQARDAMLKKFPQSYGGVRLELQDLDYEDPPRASLADQKRAILENRFLHRRLRGTWRMFDDKTGDLLEERRSTVMKVPMLTDRGTFIHGGNEYTTLHQARLMPGVFTRRKATGELETHFNVRRGTGSSFRVHLEPESGLFKMDIGQSSLRLYSLLKDIGVPDEELEKRWGPELLQANRDKYDARVFEKAYQRLVRQPKLEATREEKAQAIREAMTRARMDRRVVERTLPNLFNRKVAAAWQQGQDTDFDRADYIMLARLLDEKFGAGIPLDSTTAELVARIRAEMGELLPQVDDALLRQWVDNKRKNHENSGSVDGVAGVGDVLSWV